METFNLRAETGLLPVDMARIGLRQRADGWQAQFESATGRRREVEFPADASAPGRMAELLETEQGFSPWAANEAARQLFEPFLLDAAW